MSSSVLLSLVLLSWSFTQVMAQDAPLPEGVAIVSAYGYPNCWELRNAQTRVVIDPNAGGRVMAYEWDGVNVIYEDPAHDGWDLSQGHRPPGGYFCGGRFDVGPSHIKPNTENLFFGPWEAKALGPYHIGLTSLADTLTGLQLRREFELDSSGSRLLISQRMINISERTVRACYWGRTFAVGGGICLVPLNPQSRFPRGYVIHGPDKVIDYQPDTRNLRVEDGLLVIRDTPVRPKFEMDPVEGWLAYLTPQDRLLVKRFPIYPEQTYGEMTAATLSIWYQGRQICELEPIGPWEELAQGEQAFFQEEWWLAPLAFPKDRNVSARRIRQRVMDLIESN